MAITIKCPDCGHTKQSDDGEPETCPECEGTMAPPPKKKYQAKSSTLEDEARTKKKSKSRDEDDEDEKPKKKAKPRPKGSGPPARDGAAAESLGINPGFKNRTLMEQVDEELAGDKVLHWAGRMCPELARKQGRALQIFGFVFAGFGALGCVLVIAVAPGWAKLIAFVPLLFVGIGLAMAFVMPGLAAKQAARSWYAVTNERAVVYTAALWGTSGSAAIYEPRELRRMRVKSARYPKGAGDLIFKTTIQTVVHTSSKGSSTSEQEVHHGFLGIEDVREVETLIHNVLLGANDGRDDDDDE